MSVETELRGALTGNGAVAALVGTRVYPVVLPQNPTLPAIVYQELRTGTVVASDGDTGLREGRWQLSLWGASYPAVKGLRDAVVGAVNGYAGGVVQRVGIDAMRDDYDPETLWWRQVVEVVVHSFE